MNQCDHESETRITLSPWAIEQEFRCKKCGAKKITGSAIIPMVYTGRGIVQKKKWWQF